MSDSDAQDTFEAPWLKVGASDNDLPSSSDRDLGKDLAYEVNDWLQKNNPSTSAIFPRLIRYFRKRDPQDIHLVLSFSSGRHASFLEEFRQAAGDMEFMVGSSLIHVMCVDPAALWWQHLLDLRHKYRSTARLHIWVAAGRRYNFYWPQTPKELHPIHIHGRSLADRHLITLYTRQCNANVTLATLHNVTLMPWPDHALKDTAAEITNGPASNTPAPDRQSGGPDEHKARNDEQPSEGQPDSPQTGQTASSRNDARTSQDAKYNTKLNINNDHGSMNLNGVSVPFNGQATPTSKALDSESNTTGNYQPSGNTESTSGTGQSDRQSKKAKL